MGRGALGKSTHPHPLHARPSYLGCLMGTSSTSSGGIWKSSGSLPLAWSRSGRTSKRPLGGFQPCRMQICKQTCRSGPSSGPRPSRHDDTGEGQSPGATPQQPVPPEGLGHPPSFVKVSPTSPRNQHRFSWAHRQRVKLCPAPGFEHSKCGGFEPRP